MLYIHGYSSVHLTVYSRTHAEGGSPIWNLVFPRKKVSESAAGNTSVFYLEMAYHSHSCLTLLLSLSHVWLFSTPWTAACQASLSFTFYRSLLKLVSIESMMPINHLILCCPLLLTSVFPGIRVFPPELALCISWPKLASALASVFPMNIQGWFPLGLTKGNDLLYLLEVQGTLKSLLQHHNSKASILWCLAFFMVQLSHLSMDY